MTTEVNPQAQNHGTYCALASLRIVDMAKCEATLDALRVLRSRTLCEPGCRQFELFQMQNEADRIFLLEAFVDHAAFEAHLRETHTRDYFALGLTELLTLAPVSNIVALAPSGVPIDAVA